MRIKKTLLIFLPNNSLRFTIYFNPDVHTYLYYIQIYFNKNTYLDHVLK